MPTAPAALPARDDTLLGVCQGLGEEFGFHPNWLRVGLAALILWQPLAVIALYLALGTALAIGRWLIPVRTVSMPAAEPMPINDDAVAPALSLAA